MYIKEDRPSLFLYLAISALLHILLILLFPKNLTLPAWTEKTIEVIPIFEKNQKYDLADIAKPAVEKRPKSARFLGMYDSSVDDETVATGEKHPLPIPPPSRGRARVGGEPLYNINRKLFAAKTPDFDSEEQKDSVSTALNDYYPDYKIGVRTYLNVLRYPDVEYFVRMKRQFKMTFNPAPALRQYFSMNRVTRGSIDVVMAVSVSQDGSLAELFILNSSGVSSYDQEAMRTVRASAPFATPPGKFLADDGLLRMSWTFTVYL